MYEPAHNLVFTYPYEDEDVSACLSLWVGVLELGVQDYIRIVLNQLDPDKYPIYERTKQQLDVHDPLSFMEDGGEFDQMCKVLKINSTRFRKKLEEQIQKILESPS